jgi:hypothetical protein
VKFVYLIGAPGSGKSTAAAKVRAMASKQELHEEPVPYMLMTRGGMNWYAELGRKRASFSGTDALAMDIIDKAIGWVKTRPYTRLFAEGDRLANSRFFVAVKAAGYELTVVYLAVPQGALDERRKARATQVGKEQNAVWVKGRDSKTATLAQLFNAPRIDGTLTSAEVATQLRSYIG